MEINNAKILVCDDSILARSQLIDILKSLGDPTVIEASTGDDALQAIMNEAPDIAFMDICMPGMDGIEVLKQALSFKKRPYVVMVSSLGTKEKIMQALELGARDFIQKPFTKEHAVSVIEKSLERL